MVLVLERQASGVGHESSAFREEDVSQVQNHPSTRRFAGYL
jgi:hypothetical protein